MIPKEIHSPRATDYILLLILAAMLGSSFVLMKIAVETIPTFTTVWFRLIVAFIVLFSVMSLRGINFPDTNRLKFWAYCALLGITANIIPFSLITWAEKTIDSNLASFYMATIPIFSIGLAHLFSDDEKIKINGLIGVLISGFGTVYLLAPSITEASKGTVAQLACLSAAFFYAFSRIQTKNLSHVNPLITSTAVLFTAILTMTPFIFIIEDLGRISPSNASIISVILLGIFPTAIAYVILYSLIANVGAVFMTSVNFLVPAFGLIWGSLVLSEEASARLLLSLGIIGLGFWITSDRFSV